MTRKRKNPWADHYTLKAKQEGFPARSVYKLQEAQNKYRLLKPGDVVLDLGCAPGAWSRYALRIVVPKGLLVGLDLTPVSLKAESFVFLNRDVSEISSEQLRALSPKKYYDVVLSDLAPKTTGDRSGDHFRSLNLARRALELARELLSPQGVFMVKVFEGERFPAFREEVAGHFKKVKLFRPKSTRSSSREIFVLAFELKTASFSP